MKCVIIPGSDWSHRSSCKVIKENLVSNQKNIQHIHYQRQVY